MLNLIISNSIFSLLFTCLLLFQTPIIADEIVIPMCTTTSNYTSNSQFQTNLNLLFPSLITNTPRTGFYNNTSGENPDRVYGLAQCRGDIASQDCRSCINTATVVMLQKCPNKKEATLLYNNNCMLRYSDTPFVSELETEDWGFTWRGVNVSDPDLFNRQLSSLLNNLFAMTASNASKFMTQANAVSDFVSIYGLAQCTRDLSDQDCLSCLQFVMTKLPICCSNKPGALVVSPNCFFRYELFSFFQTSPPPPQQLQPTPRLNEGSSGNNTSDTNRNENKKKLSTSLLVIFIPLVISWF